MRSCTIRWLATSAMLVASISAECNYKTPQSIIDVIACGDRGFISQCISAKAGLSWSGQIQVCLQAGHCSQEEVSSIYNIIVPSCENVLELSFEPERAGDLRKRQNKSKTLASTAPSPATSNKPQSTSANTDSQSITDASTTADSTTADSTTVDTTSATSAPSKSRTTLSTVPSTTTTSTSSSSSSSSSSSTATTLTCLATSHIPVTWCFTSTTNAAAASSCTATTVPSIGCAPGLICATQDNGSVSCMVRQNGVTTSGLIVGIVFGVVTAGMIAALIFMCCRSRIEARKKRRLHETMPPVIAVTASGAMKNEDHIPLMTNQGPAGGQEEYSSFQNAQRRRGVSPYRDFSGGSVEVMPQGLHPELLDEDPYSGEDEDMGYRRRS